MLAAVPLFYQDVLPILERNCQSCHRAGEAAPMALETYEQARPYARAIRDSVLRRAMPPWFADTRHGPARGVYTHARATHTRVHKHTRPRASRKTRTSIPSAWLVYSALQQTKRRIGTIYVMYRPADIIKT